MIKGKHIRKSPKFLVNRELLKNQKEHKKSVTIYLEPQVAKLLKQDAKLKHGMLFSRYLEQLLVDRANRIKENEDDN